MGKEIFQPFTTHNIKAKNRLVRSATWENLATEKGGDVKTPICFTVNLPQEVWHDYYRFHQRGCT